MTQVIGIDLGTTNSAICSYNGSAVRIWKSPRWQSDVTPSAIYIAKGGRKLIGTEAYERASISKDDVAMLFKPFMGTSTPIKLPAANRTMTPEECSAEILKTLFGYLPEEIRDDPDTGTVITVPAAFDQMKKTATMQAASMAGIGRVALMQEPVAAIMSVMRTRSTEGAFVVYDLGGGTLDIAIAEGIEGRVSLLSQGGIPKCGGRDFDRLLFEDIVCPWLLEEFNLPENFPKHKRFESLALIATRKAEEAKIELSAREETTISLAEDIDIQDLDGKDIYIDIPLERSAYNPLIAEHIAETLEAAQDALKDAGLQPGDVERIVFVGGPTNYKPLRDKVSAELGIAANTDVNPMTAVAEGASIYAEEIDWSKGDGSRKATTGRISSTGELALSFSFTARTPAKKAKIAVQLDGEATPGAEFQIDSLDTGWTSGRFPLEHGKVIEVVLSVDGENTFKVSAFGPSGSPIRMKEDKIVITRTAATIEAIAASHSISVEALERLDGPSALERLVSKGDSLPKKGQAIFKATETIEAGDPESINIHLWEGEIDDPIRDNRLIGVIKISGADFKDGVISAGDDIQCEYEGRDSGSISLEAYVPSINKVFSEVYDPREGFLDYTKAAPLIIHDAQKILRRINEIGEVVDSPKLDQAREKLAFAISLDPDESDVERVQEARERTLQVRKILAEVRKANLEEIRQVDLDRAMDRFDQEAREYARKSEASAFDNLAKTAQRAIDRNDKAFEQHLEELRFRIQRVLWRQDWYVVARFKFWSGSSHLFTDKERFAQLVAKGRQAKQVDDIDRLRQITWQLINLYWSRNLDKRMFDRVNIARG